MATQAAAPVAFAVAFLGVLAATPLAIRIANRLSFYDAPGGYKEHSRPTPYLGGTAVMTGIAVGTFLAAGSDGELSAILAGACLMLAVGTLDDRRTVRPSVRILATAVAAAFLWASGVSWSLFEYELANLAFTILWVVGLVNALNLMDNMDGAAASFAAVSGGGIAACAFIANEQAIGALALALVGACLAFLRYNLRSPARVFLGDGGSMPLGFVLASAVMCLPQVTSNGIPMLIPGALLVGLGIFDTTLVIVSRYRRGVRICAGGRDHVTHRLLPSLRSPRVVVAALGLVQAVLCILGIAAMELGGTGSALVAAPCAALALCAGWVLEAQEGRRGRSRPGVAVSANDRPQRAAVEGFLAALTPRTAAQLRKSMALRGHRSASRS